MTQIFYGNAATKQAVTSMIDCVAEDEITVVISHATPGAVGIVTATWTAFYAVLDGVRYKIAAGTLDLNAVDVASPTTYWVYFEESGGVVTAKASTTAPYIATPAIEYFITNEVRFTSIAGVVRILACKYPSQDGIYELVHNLKENVLFSAPKWLTGIAPTFSAGGKITTTAGYVRFVGNEPRIEAGITEGPIVLDDETTVVAGLNDITTYSDGSAVTAGKYMKLLVGIKRNKAGILDEGLIVMRQGKPAVEYATLAAAVADTERKATTSFGSNYLAHVTPICYYAMIKGDYTDEEVTDLRESGIVGGGGGGAVTDHGALAGLGDDDHGQYYNAARHTTAVHDLLTLDHGSLEAVSLTHDDHTQYLLAAGTRGLSAAWDAGSWQIRAETFQSDVATGTAPLTVASTTVVANLNAATVNGHADTAFLHADGSVNLTGNLTVSGGITIDGVDVGAHAANTEAHHATVTFGASVAANLLGLTTQEIELDTQTANYAFMGPTSGGAVVPAFRALIQADLPVSTEGNLVLANGANANVALTAGVDTYVVTGPTLAFSISGFTGGFGGRTITILNDTVAKNMTATHDATSTAANRIWCSGTLADTSTSSAGVMVFTYYATKQRWVLVSIIT